MAKGYIGSTAHKAFLGKIKMKKGYVGTTSIYSAGNIVTYIVDSGVTYIEDVDEGISCLSPTSFTPQKNGWTFCGWRSDSTANGTVLSSKIMGDTPVTLYAVFCQTISISYSGNGATSGSTSAQTGYRYYNNGIIVNPSFTVKANGFARTNYIFTGWKSGNTSYAVGQSVTLSANLTLTAQWYTSVISSTIKQTYKPYFDSPKTLYAWYGQKYDLTWFKKLTFRINWYYNDWMDSKGKYYYDYWDFIAGVGLNNTAFTKSVKHGKVAFQSYTEEASGTVTLTLDVSTLTGYYYIGVGILQINGYADAGGAGHSNSTCNPAYVQCTSVTLS